MSNSASPAVQGALFAMPEPPAVRRSRITNDPANRASERTAGGRRVADLLRGYLRAIGNPADVVKQAAAIEAAELTVAAEDYRARLLAGDKEADPAILVRLQNLAHRAVRKLGIVLREEPAGPSWAEYLAGHGAAQAAPVAEISAGSAAAADDPPQPAVSPIARYLAERETAP